jgi:hypothetical protein
MTEVNDVKKNKIIIPFHKTASLFSAPTPSAANLHFTDKAQSLALLLQPFYSNKIYFCPKSSYAPDHALCLFAYVYK